MYDFDLLSYEKLERVKMKFIGIVILIIVLIVGMILRLNLPDNNIATYVEIGRDTNFWEKSLTKAMLSNTIADWRYLDLVVVKFACSEKLEMALIGKPFQKWRKYDYAICQ